MGGKGHPPTACHCLHHDTDASSPARQRSLRQPDHSSMSLPSPSSESAKAPAAAPAHHDPTAVTHPTDGCIRVRGAREHNLKNVDVVIPRNCLVDRKSTRLNSSHLVISYAVFCLKKKKNTLST